MESREFSLYVFNKREIATNFLFFPYISDIYNYTMYFKISYSQTLGALKVV